MHIDPTTHEHGANPKVYSYEADYEVGDNAITWKAVVSQGGTQRGTFTGEIPLTSPGIATVAEQVVRDEIVKRIDTFEDKRDAGSGGVGPRR
jgi:hypothetical protein